MELYQKVRRAVMIDGMSRRSAAKYFGIDRKTIEKMLVFPAPPPHGRIELIAGTTFVPRSACASRRLKVGWKKRAFDCFRRVINDF